mmetsp:Transcript_26670/g.40326  ORF Transcript_26670/g.40326 Transcript_26670/m.40326 type:complete len:226 (-) Transcript_26670:112-789(-)
MLFRSIILICPAVIHGFVSPKLGVTKTYVSTQLGGGTMDAYDAQMNAMRRVVAPAPAAATVTVPKTVYTRDDLCGKEFQLEELEDKEECETEVWLNEDGTVSLGASNGPLVRDYAGEWHLLETAGVGYQPFRMRLTRRFESPGSGRIGDIQYDLTREFWGSIEMVGESICVNGKIHGALPSAETNQYAQMYHDDQAMQETEIGYFTMIDAVASDGIEGVKGTLHP